MAVWNIKDSTDVIQGIIEDGGANGKTVAELVREKKSFMESKQRS